MSLGFIGCGNMASAIIDGIIKKGTFIADSIYVYDISQGAALAQKEKHGVRICDSEADVVRHSDTVILAVKPNILSSVLDKINLTLAESNTLLISIAAGKTLAFIRDRLTHDNRILRVMPNINATVCEAICAYTANESATPDDRLECERIFNSVGQAVYLEEKLFPLFGVIGGSAPAFAYLFIDELARAAVQHGMKKDFALQIAAQTVLGSAKMILESDAHPYELIDRVCSPGGTTIEGITSLQADGFANAIHKAVDKALEKDSKL